MKWIPKVGNIVGFKNKYGTYIIENIWHLDSDGTVEISPYEESELYHAILNAMKDPVLRHLGNEIYRNVGALISARFPGYAWETKQNKNTIITSLKHLEPVGKTYLELNKLI